MFRLLMTLIVMLETEARENDAVESGKIQYELINRDANLPRYGQCWTRSLDELNQGCKELTDERQSRLALNFANCFLAMSGQTTYSCDASTPISECLQAVDNKAFSAFSTFFTHTHNMCQFLQSQIWRDKTEDTISRLTDQSDKVASAISNWSQLQDVILTNQVATLDYQRQIMENGSLLSLALESSRENARQLMDEFQRSTEEQRTLIFSIFDRVSKLQSLVVSEVSWIYTVVFYAGFLLLVYVMTATKRTADARFPLLMLFTLNAVVERCICSCSLGGEDAAFQSYPGVDDVPETISQRIWIARKLSLLTALVFLGYSLYNFKDYSVINNELLLDIHRQNLELRNVMKILQSSAAGSFDHTDSRELGEDKSISLVNDASDHDDDDDSSTLSFDSAATDRTWMVTFDDSAPDSEFEDDFFDEVLLSPEQLQMEPNVNSSSDNVIESAVSSDHPVSAPLEKPRGRLSKGGRSSTPRRSATPQATSPPSRYNLRDRSFLRRHCQYDNPILDSESPNSFMEEVKRMYNISKANASLVREAVKKSKLK